MTKGAEKGSHPESSDDDLDDDKHTGLLSSIGVDVNDNKTNKNKQVRTEASQDVSVFSLLGSSADGAEKKVNLGQLLKGVKESANVNVLKQQLNKVNRPQRHLDAPLSKPVAERLQRKVEYEKTSAKLAKWDPIVQNHRKADHISFPLTQQPLQINTLDKHLSKKGRRMTPLEQEIYALLNGNKCVERPDHDLSLHEEELLASVSLEEAEERRAELQKHRALMSYHESKSKRQKKIKSKKYHRMLRKRKMKEDAAADDNTPEDALQRAERMRAEERASLRHRTGSKWARSRAIMAKHDKESKELLNEQLQKHRELVTKPQISADESDEENPSDDDRDGDDSHYTVSEKMSSNPWLRANSKVKEESGVFVEEADEKKSICEESNTLSDQEEDATNGQNGYKLRNWLSSRGSESDVAKEVVEASSTDAVEKFKEAFKNLQSSISHHKNIEEPKEAVVDVERKKAKLEEAEKLDGLIQEQDIEEYDVGVRSQEMEVLERPSDKLNSGPVNTNPSASFSSRPVKISEENLEFHVDEERDMSHDERQQMTIEQAFADDDVVSEFAKSKRQIVEEDKPKVVSLALPGWGDWGGVGIKPSKRKKKRFRVKAPPAKPRLDQKLGHVIINETRDVHIAKHQVNTVPFPFTNKEQFERTVAQPIGTTWNTQSAFNNFVKPKVETIPGSIIPPMNSDEALQELKKATRTKEDRKRLKRKSEHKSKLEKLKIFV